MVIIVNRAKIVFVNGESITVSEGQLLFPFRRIETKDKVFISKWEPVKLWDHLELGLLPGVGDMLASCEFFSLTDSCEKLYRSSAVLSIEQI